MSDSDEELFDEFVERLEKKKIQADVVEAIKDHDQLKDKVHLTSRRTLTGPRESAS